MKHTVLVGMEVHLQLRTRSKMFCGCPVRFGAPVNTLVCPVCLGMPGSLPVPNREALTMALALATAMGSEIADLTKFDRKNYFYPDLPKGYQISQYDRPLATGGVVEVVTEAGVKPVRLRRLHIEEDVGKNLHDDAVSRVDFNRAGTPLVEIVSEPDITSPEEARAYLNALRALVHYLDVSDANMQEGNLRCEPNVNLHIEDKGRVVKTPIIEVKNLNSVRNVERAVQFEIERQLAEYREKGAAVASLPRATRGYDDQRDQTFVMRVKEEAHDYRYFPEPDTPPLAIDAR
ncbi:MAG: Asp-tRNA(Asn)/Glu-tRNA(Gln) amidotransferase subunit GatB, partial [Planctomycetota bacterium]